VAVTAQFLVGADGARSLVRNHLEIEWGGETGIAREFMGGKMFAMYLRAPTFASVMPHPKAWMYVAVNHQRRAFMASVDGVSEYACHAALHPGEDSEPWGETDARRIFAELVGHPLPVEVLSTGTWLAGHALVARSFGRGRVFIGGDAAHLFTPTGGLGYNTAVEDAVNLAWKLAAVLRKQAPMALLDSYEAERRPLAIRNTGFARRFADSVGLFRALPELGGRERAGRIRASPRLRVPERTRTPRVRHSRRHLRRALRRFTGRRQRCSAVPPDLPNTYVPTAKPGGRPPHAWLDDGRSLFDLFGPDWTLLVLGKPAQDVGRFEHAATVFKLDLQTLRLEDERLLELYEAPLVLVRPDQIVAWRGDSDHEADAVLQQVTGRADRARAARPT
jgi:hypothetical protein